MGCGFFVAFWRESMLQRPVLDAWNCRNLWMLLETIELLLTCGMQLFEMGRIAYEFFCNVIMSVVCIKRCPARCRDNGDRPARRRGS
jgi:hypothetical protein